ncbi:MAG: metal-sensitive transcriptional regulator [Thermotogota bacterium]|nr:metal-sensitive transcriptional regulator [Thermotogota bacterium]
MQKPEDKKKVINRLKRAEGQLRGLQKMIEEDRTCTDILNQVSAVISALSKISEMIAKTYAKKCVLEINEKGDTSNLNELIENLINLRRI